MGIVANLRGPAGAALPGLSIPASAGDGLTDDTAAINAAISSGGIAYLPAATYRVAGTVLGRSNVTLAGAGKGLTTLLLDDVAAYGISVNANAGVTHSTTLTADMRAGDRTVAVVSSAGFAVGDTIMMRPETGSSDNFAFGGWMPRISALTGTSVTFDESAPVAMTAADNTTLYGFNPVKHFVVRDLTIKTNTSTPALRNRLIYMLRCLSCSVVDCEVMYAAGTSAMGVYFSQSRDMRCERNDVEGVLAGNTAEPLNFDTVTKLSVSGNNVRNCSGGVTIARSPHSTVQANRITMAGTASPGRPIKLMDQSNYGNVIGNTCRGWNTAHTGIRLADSAYCTVSGNQLSDGGTGIDLNTDQTESVQTPYRVLTKFNVVTGNVIDGMALKAVDHEPNGAIGVDCFNLISGNVIHNVGGPAIAVGSNSNTVTDNTIVDYAAVSTTGFDGIIVSNGCTNNLIQGNKVSNPSHPGIQDAIQTLAPGGNRIINNDCGAELVHVTTTDYLVPPPDVVTVAYSSTLGIVASRASRFKVTIGDTAAHTFTGPTQPTEGQQIVWEIINGTAGAVATGGWQYQLSSAWVPPAAGKRKLVGFQYSTAISKFVEIFRTVDY